MDLYEFIILMIGMAFWGTVPPVVVAWYIQKKGEEMRKKNVDAVVNHAEKVLVARFEKAKEDLLKSVKCSIDGLYGNKVKELKKTINDKLQVDTGPMGKVIGDLVGGVAEDYGYGKKKVVANGIMALFQKKSPQQFQQDQAIVNSYLPPDVMQQFK